MCAESRCPGHSVRSSSPATSDSARRCPMAAGRRARLNENAPCRAERPGQFRRIECPGKYEPGWRRRRSQPDIGTYFLGLACFAVLYGREHRVRILNEVLEGDAESNVHFGLRVDRSLKNRLDGDLGDPHCGFDRLRAVVALTNERPRLLDARIA